MGKNNRLKPAQIKALMNLDEAFGREPDAPVANVEQEARELALVVKKYGKALHAKSALEPKLSGAIGARLVVLETSDATWSATRDARTPKGLLPIRREADVLKSDIVAALRHFVEGDAAVQARVDKIQQGSGDPDRIDDLQKLADLVEENAARLKKADLPKNAAKLARDLARTLGAGVAAQPMARTAGMGTGDADPRELRNRAFWSLREAMDAVRAAGRYVYRREPKLLALFRGSTSRATPKRKPSGTNGKPVPTAPSPNA